MHTTSATGAVPKQKLLGPLVLIAVLGLLVSLPLLLHGLPDLSNDGVDHARFDSNFAVQFWGGELYPRWMSNVNGGLGGASMYFYPPLQSFVATLFWPLLHGHDPWGWFISGYACVLASVLAGITAFLWLRRWVGARGALFGAAVYVIAPYHVAIDLYNRGAAAEYWIFVWLPLVMWATEALVAGKRYALPALIVAYSLCVYSHATVGAVSAGLPVAYALVFARSGRRLQAFALTIFGLLVGVGTAGMFLLPAVLDQPKTWVSLQTTDWGDYRNWWLFDIRDKITEAGTQGAGIPWYFSYKMRVLVITLWMLLFGAVSALLITRRESRKWRQAVFYLGVMAAVFFLMIRQSDLVWRLVPVLRLMQFPTRLGTFLVVAAAPLAAFAFAASGRRFRWAPAVLVLSLAGWGLADFVSARQAYSNWRYIPPARAERAAGLLRTQQEYFTFWPKPAEVTKYIDIPPLEKFIAEHPPKTAHLQENSAGGSVTIRDWKPRSILLAVKTPAAGTLILNHLFMQGWRARIAGTAADLPLRPTSPDGLISVDLPKGTYQLVIDLPRDSAERTGAVITLMSLLLLVGITVWESRRRARSDVSDAHEVPHLV